MKNLDGCSLAGKNLIDIKGATQDDGNTNNKKKISSNFFSRGIHESNVPLLGVLKQVQEAGDPSHDSG